MSEKRPKSGPKWPECALFVSKRLETKNGPYSGLRGSKPNSEGTYSTRKHPPFVVPKPLNHPNETPRPRYQWSLGAAGAQPRPRMVGANGGSTGVLGAKKMIFTKVFPRPFAMLNQEFLGRFEP